MKRLGIVGSSSFVSVSMMTTTVCVLYMDRIGVCPHCGDLCSFHGSATLGTNLCRKCGHEWIDV